MIHYSIWFRLRDSMEEAEGLAIVQTFLNDLRAAGEIAGFQILRNRSGNKTMRLPFQALLIEFRDNAQFGAAFSAQATRGIHNGLHGRVMALVEDFQTRYSKRLPRSMARHRAKAADNLRVKSEERLVARITIRVH